MSRLTGQNRMSYLKARDLHLFSPRRINHQLDICVCSNAMAQLAANELTNYIQVSRKPRNLSTREPAVKSRNHTSCKLTADRNPVRFPVGFQVTLKRPGEFHHSGLERPRPIHSICPLPPVSQWSDPWLIQQIIHSKI